LSTPVVKEQDVKKNWYVIDATDKVIGRLAVEVARILTGKKKPEYVDYIDVGDFVVIVNAEKVKFTGNKWNDKKYYRHSGYPGGLTEVVAKDMLKKHPERIIINAVKGMLPKNKLRALRLKKMKVYTGAEHPHAAQKPEKIEL